MCTVSNTCILLHVCVPGNHLNQDSLGSWKVMKFYLPGKLWKVKVMFGRLVTADVKGRTIR